MEKVKEANAKAKTTENKEQPEGGFATPSFVWNEEMDAALQEIIRRAVVTFEGDKQSIISTYNLQTIIENAIKIAVQSGE